MPEKDTLTNIAHRTKVIPPKLPTRILPRPQLILKIEQALETRLTLVIAGAGYGKTTALLQGLEEIKRRRTPPAIAWLQLDEFDAEKTAFFGALVSSVEYTFPGFFKRWRSQLLQMSDIEFAQHFAGELAAIPKVVILVIEDAHLFLRDDDHKTLKALSPILEQLPSNVQCVITSRRALPLECLPLMRARQELTILDKEDFSLSIEEVRRLLTDIYDENVHNDIVPHIAQQVDGWITGLILLRQARHVMEIQTWESIVGSISAGSHEFFYAYFMSEVYESLSENMRRCLRLVSELPEWSPDIVQVMYGPEYAKEFTRYVNDDNALFILPMDDARTRFRFHHMFRDFLHAHGPLHSTELRKLAEFESAGNRHRVAARLYQQSKNWGLMLESLYTLQFITRNEILPPEELHEMIETVPGKLRVRLQVWWVLRAAERIALGKPAEVAQLPANYTTFREPYKSKYLTMLVNVMRGEYKYSEIVGLLSPILQKHLAKPEEIYPQEIIVLAVYLCLTLVDISMLREAKEWVDWIEQRKAVTPDYEEDDMTYIVLRAYYQAVKNKEHAVFYAEKYAEYCRTSKPNNYSMSLLNLGITQLRFEMLEEAERSFTDAEEIALTNKTLFTKYASIVQIAQAKLYQGNTNGCSLLLTSISLEDKRKNSYLSIEVTKAELNAYMREGRTPSESVMRNAKEIFEQFKNKDEFFILGQLYRQMDPGKINAFVEREGQYFIDHGADVFDQGMARLAVESERMRVKPKLYATWEKAAHDLFLLDGIEYMQPSDGEALYLLEILENIPSLAPKVLDVLEYSAHTIAWYLQMHWGRLEADTRSMMLQFLVGKMARPHIARAVKSLLEKLQIDAHILDSTNVIQQAAVSPHLNEHEVGEILLKYGGITLGTANVLKEFSVREPAPLFIRMFGKFEILKGDAVVVFSEEIAQPMLSLLKFFIKNKNRAVTMDEIGTTIWKEVSEKQLKSNVYTAVSLLRSTLEPYLQSAKESHFILSAERGYKFASRKNDLVDTDKFTELCESASKTTGERAVQQLIRAVDLYRGPFLEENLFDPWADSERDKYQQMYVQALETIVVWRRKTNEWDDIELYAGKGFDLDPASEEFCGALLECATVRGDSQKVKKIFQEYQNAMREFYRDNPSKLMQDLYLSCIERASI